MAKMSNFSSYFLLLALCVVAINPTYAYERTLPAIFIFGDSAIDIGTNSYLNSYARANFRYNGIDFPQSRPTGRFSNGYNIGDQLAMKFGFKKSPAAFLDIMNRTTPIHFQKKIQRGVNFASAGSGIFDDTGSKAWNAVVPLSLQIQQFNTVIGNITQVRGPKATAKILSKALYIFCFGANEFFDYMRAKNNTPKEEFVAGVQSAYHVHLKDVYNMGARKFGIIGVPPIGCCPYARAINEKEGGEGCMQLLNDFAQAFYNSTLTLLQRMTSELPNFKYSLGNTYAMTMDLFDNYPSFGFKNIKTACCGLGNYSGEVGCYEPINPILCSNRSEYLFWDLYHPSQAASQLLAYSLYNGDAKYMTPMNFSQLADVQVHM